MAGAPKSLTARIRRLRRGVPVEAAPVRPSAMGAAFDAAVARARTHQLPAGVDPDYDLVREHFDDVHYLLQIREPGNRPDGDLVEHFLEGGAEAPYSPEPGFGMPVYLARYPRRREGRESPYVGWLREGRDAGEIGDPTIGLARVAPVLGMTPPELAEKLGEVREDLTERLRYGALGEQLAKAAAIEPLISSTWAATTQPRIQPVNAPEITDQVVALHACQEQAGFARARLVFVINRPRWGSGRRIEGHVAHALRDRVAPEDVVVIYTDQGGSSPEGRFPAGVREVDFAAAARELTPPQRARVLVELIRSLHAEAVLNINSRVLYDALGPYGRALAASERIFPVMFCNEQLTETEWGGWSLKHFYRVIDHVPAVITDSQFLKDELTDRNLLPDEVRDRIHVFRAPVEPAIPLAPVPDGTPGRRPQVYWSGRWDRQKRVDLVMRIARELPDVDFHLWGERVLQGDPITDVPDNVTLEGRYASFADLDLGRADAWLYTSAWDGVPQLLLEVAMTGIPIVASVVGGVGELLPEGEAWPIRDVDDPAAYAGAIRSILADPADARARARQLRERLLVERSEQAYAEAAATLLLEDAR